jgi:hypothetical protein
MRVRIDEARRYDKIGGIDCPLCSAGDRTDFCDPPPDDPNVGPARRGASAVDDEAVPDEKVVCHRKIGVRPRFFLVLP